MIYPAMANGGHGLFMQATANYSNEHDMLRAVDAHCSSLKGMVDDSQN